MLTSNFLMHDDCLLASLCFRPHIFTVFDGISDGAADYHTMHIFGLV